MSYTDRKWSPEEEVILRKGYGVDGLSFSVTQIAQCLNRTEASIACKASKLELCDSSRPKSKSHRASMSKQRKGKPAHNKGKHIWNNKVHPRGMKGKRHTLAARQAISSKQVGRKQAPAFVDKRLQATLKKFGSLSPHRPHGKWKSGWRMIAGRKIYARSRWEANYGRYLQFLKEAGEIQEWEHEPQTFWFENIKRGTRSYLPDYRVTLKDGSIVFHEVKGWNDARSKTKAKRMKKYFPEIIVILRDSKWFRANSLKLSGLIPEWER